MIKVWGWEFAEYTNKAGAEFINFCRKSSLPPK